MTAVTVFWVLCAQAVIGCTWQLVTRVKKERIFSEASLAWAIVVCAVALGVRVARRSN